MKCEKCGQEFKPHDNAEVGDAHQDDVEVKTSCQCGAKYYTFATDFILDPA